MYMIILTYFYICFVYMYICLKYIIMLCIEECWTVNDL